MSVTRPHLALEVDGAGAHPAAGHAGPAGDIAALTARVTTAEAAGFALVTIADAALPPPGGPARVEAGVRASFLSRRTQRIGLAPTLHVTVTEPFHLATQLASLDHASLGRAGWVVGADHSAAVYATVGLPRLDGAALRQELADGIDVARQLWDSWEDDAIIRDRVTSRFLDADRVHHVNFTGERFSVVGPLITPRPPQGQLVVLGADTLGVTGRLDVALVAAPTVDEVADRARQARTDGAPLVFADLDVLLGADRLAALDAVAPWGPAQRLRHTGSAEDLRDLLERLAGLVDGVRLHPAELHVDLPRLATGLGRRPVTGPTLRDTLGLHRPANRFATAG
ncbi:LLM class flavin-dependent oxidoreductase [Actinoplanes palleronii]|uniref:Monooxygenase n=1 Tax=Actinoplanes palleronii TaxID=113570 RepID=A0ABQ4BS97_9ACTN|nr:LLM class flavin-dependent oxidoreductase [Actinoplanes palleronii]GIE73515.1 monooxygenase [Actinoplanes palleronii]